nr:MAG TPA: hypothetical protein [Caudoviricetes sp.]
MKARRLFYPCPWAQKLSLKSAFYISLRTC